MHYPVRALFGLYVAEGTFSGGSGGEVIPAPTTGRVVVDVETIAATADATFKLYSASGVAGPPLSALNKTSFESVASVRFGAKEPVLRLCTGTGSYRVEYHPEDVPPQPVA